MVLQFWPAWCYALPLTMLDIPLALWEATLWTATPYFAVGYYKDAGRSVNYIFVLSVKCSVLHQGGILGVDSISIGRLATSS